MMRRVRSSLSSLFCNWTFATWFIRSNCTAREKEDRICFYNL